MSPNNSASASFLIDYMYTTMYVTTRGFYLLWLNFFHIKRETKDNKQDWSETYEYDFNLTSIFSSNA